MLTNEAHTLKPSGCFASGCCNTSNFSNSSSFIKAFAHHEQSRIIGSQEIGAVDYQYRALDLLHTRQQCQRLLHHHGLSVSIHKCKRLSTDDIIYQMYDCQRPFNVLSELLSISVKIILSGVESNLSLNMKIFSLFMKNLTFFK